MDRDTRKLLRHSTLLGVLLVRWAVRAHRYIYTLAVLLFVLDGGVSVHGERIAHALLLTAAFVLLAHTVEFLERRFLAPLRQPKTPKG